MKKKVEFLDNVFDVQVKKQLDAKDELIAGLRARLEKCEFELDETKKGELPSMLDELSNIWQEPVEVDSKDPVHFVDPIYGELEVEHELVPVLMQPLVQRLNYVRQLSFSYFDHPTAQHTRFSHSLGVAKNAETVLLSVFKKDVIYGQQGESVLGLRPEQRKEYLLLGKLAGMLHDLGHGPFGHALDRLIGYEKKIGIADVDKYFSAQYIQEYLSEQLETAGFSADRLARIFGPKKAVQPLGGFDKLISEIVDSPLDVDRLDYLVRDAHTTGLQAGFVNPRNLLERVAPFELENGEVVLTYQSSTLHFVEHFFYARDVMYVTCYEEDRKAAAEEMLVVAVKDLIDNTRADLGKLMLLDDMSLLHLMLRTGSKSDAYYSLSKMLVSGQLFRKAREFHLDEIDEVESKSIRRALIDDAGVAYFKRSREYAERIANRHSTFKGKDWKVLVALPSPNAFHQAEANVRLLMPGGKRVEKAGKISPILERIAEIIQNARLTVRVYVPMKATVDELDEVCKVSESVFGRKAAS